MRSEAYSRKLAYGSTLYVVSCAALKADFWLSARFFNKIMKIMENHPKTSNLTSSKNSTRPHSGPAWKRFLPIASLASGFVIFLIIGPSDYSDLQSLADKRIELKNWVGSNLVLAAAVYIVAYVSSTAFFLPFGTIITLAGGFLFGTFLGGTLAIIGATIGSSILFIAARTALSAYFQKRIGPHASNLRKRLNENAFYYLLALRLAPVFPFAVVNVAPALVGMRLRTYVTATFIGIIPATYVYASVGAGLDALFSSGDVPDLNAVVKWEFMLPLFLLAVLSLVPVLLKRARRQE